MKTTTVSLANGMAFAMLLGASANAKGLHRPPAQRLRVPNQIIQRNARLNPAQRLKAASRLLQTPISPRGKVGRAVLAAHALGAGQPGKMGPAGINIDGSTNYTFRQILGKARLLKKAGIAKANRRKLMDAGITGNGRVFIDFALHVESKLDLKHWLKKVAWDNNVDVSFGPYRMRALDVRFEGKNKDAVVEAIKRELVVHGPYTWQNDRGTLILE